MIVGLQNTSVACQPACASPVECELSHVRRRQWSAEILRLLAVGVPDGGGHNVIMLDCWWRMELHGNNAVYGKQLSAAGSALYVVVTLCNARTDLQLKASPVHPNNPCTIIMVLGSKVDWSHFIIKVVKYLAYYFRVG